MAAAKLESQWDQAASIMSVIHNVQCVKSADQKPPAHFHPFLRRRARKPPKIEVPLSAITEILTRMKRN